MTTHTTYKEIVTSSWSKARPLNALFELTHRCNYDCAFCYNPKVLKGELDTATAKLVIDRLAELGVLYLTFTGGEATLRPDLLELIAHARKLDFAVVLFTNGHRLDDALVAALKAHSVLHVEISLHGATAATHDATVEIPGSFERIMAALERCRAAGLRVVIKTLVRSKNFDELRGIKAIADSFGFPVKFDTAPSPKDDGDRSPLQEGMTPEQYRVFWKEMARDLGYERLPFLERFENGANCAVGAGMLAVDPYGDVYPCIQWRQSVGNLAHQDSETVWASDGLRRIREASIALNDKMMREHGDLATRMFICPGSNVTMGKDPTHIDPASAERARIVQSLNSSEASDERDAPEAL